MPRGVYKRSEAQLQQARERMKKLGLGRKGKKKTDPHAQPMEEVKPTPAEPTPTPIPEPTPVPEKPIEEINKDLDLTAEEEKKKEEVPPKFTPNRPLTGPEIRKMQEESGETQ